jgi:hypothetical protein
MRWDLELGRKACSKNCATCLLDSCPDHVCHRDKGSRLKSDCSNGLDLNKGMI